ncbi:MAG: ACP S-malonyltransferase [Acidimicrobiia bacterium]|nr:ACP S-malonyltransferase [Acidimicrobiia bacterium]
MEYAVLFPGQGSQFVGMGATLFDTRPELLGHQADEALGWSLRDACLEGPADHLRKTDIAQPALYALSYAAWTLWSERVAQPPIAAAGHSLGEYTALAAAGVLDYFDGLALVAERGRAMSAAAADIPSGMAAVMGAEVEELEAICSRRRNDGGRLWVANLNAPGQTVLAGADVDIAWLVEQTAQLGLRRVVPLEVAGAFHTPLMDGAAAAFSIELTKQSFLGPTFPVWSNVDATPYGGDATGSLLRQLTSPVRFGDSLAAMAAAGAEGFLHLGPGSVTTGMARRAVDGAQTAAAADSTTISQAAAQLELSVD